MTQTLTVSYVLKQATEQLAAHELYYGHGTACARDDAAQLLLFVLDLPADTPLEQAPSHLSQQQYTRLQHLLTARITQHKPAAYLTNTAYFAGLDFYVDERVLIPRSPLAELIEQRFAPWFSPEDIGCVLELGTGSGCIAIAVAHYLVQASVDAVDIDAGALAVAAQNRARHQLQSRVNFLQSDLFNDVPCKQYDIIISNPPYVDAKDMASLPAEYRHEPELGLAAGADGLSIVNRILSDAAAYLSPQGVLIVEVGNSQAALEQTYPDLPFIWLEFARGGEGVFLLYASDLSANGLEHGR